VATSYIHTCYRIRDPQKSEDFYVNKLGMKKVGEMDLGSATNHFFAFEEDPSEPMLELVPPTSLSTIMHKSTAGREDLGLKALRNAIGSFFEERSGAVPLPEETRDGSERGSIGDRRAFPMAHGRVEPKPYSGETSRG
jgi:catechol 2,3-dioxygenase-like lactoylglutathione lyase family enzyme